MAAWFVAEASYESLGTNKLGLAHAFKKRIMGRFAPYFMDLKPCIMALFHAMYPNGPKVETALTHDGMVKIFTETLEKLPPHDAHWQFGKTQKKSSGSRKHLVCIFDNCVFLTNSVKRMHQTKSDTQKEQAALVKGTACIHCHRRSTPVSCDTIVTESYNVN
jgi:hypothetical protein